MTTPNLEEAKAVLAELAALHEEGWCACRSSTLPARVQSTLGDLIAALSAPPDEDVRDASSANLDALSDYRERRPRVTVTLTRLREVWAALGCAYNPNDFHISVQQTMWTQALNMIREATEQTSRVYRENQQLEEALLVARAALSAPPAEDVREALDLDVLEAKARAATPGPWMLDGMGKDEPEVNYWAHRFIGALDGPDIIATSEDGHGPNAEYIAAASPDVILALIDRVRAIVVRPRGTVTDAEALRLGKVAWVAYQEDKSWAESVVEDCFSPADDLPEEALDMIAVARAVLEAAAGVVSAGPATTVPAPAAHTEAEVASGLLATAGRAFASVNAAPAGIVHEAARREAEIARKLAESPDAKVEAGAKAARGARS